MSTTEAKKGNLVIPRLNIGDAYIEGVFHTVEAGKYRDKPALLVVVDFHLSYSYKAALEHATFKLRFGSGSDGEDACAVGVFAPLDLAGPSTNFQREDGGKVFGHLPAPWAKAVFGFENTWKENRSVQNRWRVQGGRETRKGADDTVTWHVTRNRDNGVEDRVPRNLRVGVIVRVPKVGEGLYVETKVEGALSGRPWKSSSGWQRRALDVKPRGFWHRSFDKEALVKVAWDGNEKEAVAPPKPAENYNVRLGLFR